MYSQDAISSRKRERPGPTSEMHFGLACVVCRTDYRDAPDTEAMVVSHHGDEQMLACEGVCARLASGSAAGLDEKALPLDERVRRHEERPQPPKETPAS